MSEEQPGRRRYLPHAKDVTLASVKQHVSVSISSTTDIMLTFAVLLAMYKKKQNKALNVIFYFSRNTNKAIKQYFY